MKFLARILYSLKPALPCPSSRRKWTRPRSSPAMKVAPSGVTAQAFIALSALNLAISLTAAGLSDKSHTRSV